MAQQFYPEPDYRRDNDGHNVYDDASRGTEGGTSQKTSNSAEDAERASLFNNDGDIKKSGINSLANMTSVGSSALGATLGNTTTGRLAKLGAALWSTNRRKAMTIGGGGLSGVLIAGGALFITSLVPLRINSFVQNWQEKGMATSSNAIENESDVLLRNYLVKKVTRGMVENRCTSTHINKSCAAKSSTTNPVGALYNTWRDANLEGKLASKYGIEIQKSGNKFYLTTNHLQNKIELGEYTPGNTADFDNKAFAEMSRSDVRREMRSAFQNETRLKQVMYRFSVGKLLERKYGIRRCILACEKRDKVTNSIEARKNAFKSIFNERVIAPRSEMYSLIVDCAMNSFSCTQGDQVDAEGHHTSQFERDLQARLEQFRLTHGETDLNKLLEDSKELREKGITHFIVGKIAGETTAKLASKGLPVIGWMDLGARLINGAQNAGPAIKKLTYVTYATTAIQTYMTYQSSADETKAGKTDLMALGSISDSLNASPDTDQGGISAEQTPLYQSYFGANGENRGKSFAMALLPSASAATSNAKCNDGKPYPKGEILCPEQQVGAKSFAGSTANLVSKVADSPMLKVAGWTADAWLSTFGRLLDAAAALTGDALAAAVNTIVPQSILNDVKGFGEKIITTIIDNVVVSPLSDNISGGRLGDIAAAGPSFINSDYSQSKLGGKALNPKEVASIHMQQESEAQRQFADEPLFARMFSTDSQYSFISRLAVAMPGSTTGLASSIASIITANPLRHFLDGFGSLFSIPGADAAVAVSGNPWGISEPGYTSADIAAIGDPEVYWETHCTDLVATNTAWGESATENPDTGMFENSTTNPCLLIPQAVGAAGGRYNTALIPDSGSDGTDITSSVNTGGVIDQSTVFDDSTGIACAAGTKDLGTQDGYHDGTKVPIRICAVTGMKSSSGESHDQYGVIGADGDTVVNSRVSANVLAMFKAAKADGVVLSADSSFRTMSHQQSLCPCDGRRAAKPGYSNHQMGLAIDFSEPSVVNTSAQTCSTRVKDESSAQWNWLEENAARYGFRQYSAESWHWDVLDSANRCGGGDG